MWSLHSLRASLCVVLFCAPFIKSSLITASVDELENADFSAISEGSNPAIIFVGPLHHVHLMNAIHQFSNGVRAALLNDANFEHDTQATTGGTTGDWLVIFDELTDSAVKVYDGLSLSVRAKGLSLGVIDPKKSSRTAKRFGISSRSGESIEVILLRHSRLYRFGGPIKRSDFDDILNFATKEYQAHPQSVIPRPRMVFDEVVDWLVEISVALAKQYGQFTVFAFGTALLLILMLAVTTAITLCFWAIRRSQSATLPQPTPEPLPHEAGDDGGAYKIKKSKAD
ncbi:unnamed protein product [Calicophoron daubneyi]|uniref:Protein BIG1 n=1 Tax=Calicophoron daubneyi TaxID=300641 RepID=A0AAV2TGM7_CALDB